VHEDNLVNHRILWLITFNGLLFAAYGFSLGAEGSYISGLLISAGRSDSDPASTQQAITLMQNFGLLLERVRSGLAFAGVSSSVLAYVGILAAISRIRNEKIRYKYIWGNDQSNNQARQNLVPPVSGHISTNILGALCALGMPTVLFGVWMWIGAFHKEDLVSAFGLVLLLLTVVSFVGVSRKKSHLRV